MGKQANYKIAATWGLIALAAVILVITGTSFAGNNLFTPDFSSCGPLAQEAEDGNLHGAMQIGEEDGKKYIFVPDGIGHSGDVPHPDNRADYCMKILQGGTYTLQAVVSADNDSQDSFWIVINGTPYLWDTGFGRGFNLQPITSRADGSQPIQLELDAGQAIISVHQRETQAKLDRIELVPTSFEIVPTEEPEDPGNIGGEIPGGGSAICGGMVQEAELATLFGAMQIGERADASGKKFVYVPDGVGNALEPNSGHRADFCVMVPQDGNYLIHAGADAPDSGRDSMHITIDGGPAKGYLWEPAKGAGFVADIIHDRGVNEQQIVYLTQGEHLISFHHREPRTMLDWIRVEPVAGDQSPDPTATATSVPPTPTSPPPTAMPSTDECGGLVVEAESADLVGGFAIGKDGDASGGEYIYIPASVGNVSGGKFDPENRADFCVEIEEAGQYQMMAWARTPNFHTSDSFFITVDGNPTAGFVWDVEIDDRFTNSYVTARGVSGRLTLNLTAGKHTISFHRREAETHLDRFELIWIPGNGQPIPTATATTPATATPTKVVTQEPTAVPPTATVAPTETTVPPTATPVQAACSSSLLREAESGTLKGAFAVKSNPAASGSRYILIPTSAGHAPNGGLDVENTASYCFNITSAGTYKIAARTIAPDIAHDSFFVRVDGAPAAGYLWDVDKSTAFSNGFVSDRGKSNPTTFFLTEGNHTITFHRRESGTILDKIELVNIDEAGSPIEPTATATSHPPTATPITQPPTATPVPPTATPIPSTGGEVQARLLYPVDIRFNNPSWSGNPFDLIATVTFTHHGSGLKRQTEMFYNGDNEWVARFTPDRTGKWSYSTQSGDGDLNGKVGSVQVSNSSAKGFVQASGGKWVRSRTGEAFTPQFVMLDELDVYYNNRSMIDADLDNFMGDHGFNGIHIRGYCRWFYLETDRCIYVPSDERDPDIRTFEIVEEMILAAYERGGTTHIWMYGDNMRKHNTTDWGLNGTEDRRMQRYFAARLGAVPGWTMGYGYDVFEWASASQIEQWYSYIDSRMMYPHLMGARGNKNQIMQYTEVLSYSSYEQHLPDYDTYEASMNDRPHKPSFSEDRFRTREAHKPHKDYLPDDVRQGMYRSSMVGGIANIWGNLASSEPGPGSITYPNKAELKRYAEFFENRFTVDVERCNSLTDGVCLKRPTNQHYLFYKEGTSSVQLNLSGMSGSQPFVAMNTITGQTVSGTFQPNQQTWSAPSQSDWVIAVGNW